MTRDCHSNIIGRPIRTESQPVYRPGAGSFEPKMFSGWIFDVVVTAAQVFWRKAAQRTLHEAPNSRSKAMSLTPHVDFVLVAELSMERQNRVSNNCTRKQIHHILTCASCPLRDSMSTSLASPMRSWIDTSASLLLSSMSDNIIVDYQLATEQTMEQLLKQNSMLEILSRVMCRFSPVSYQLGMGIGE
jgi:hypothetical protein